MTIHKTTQLHYLDPSYRSTFIGGSEAGAILGLDPWKTAVQVWDSKVNPPTEREQESEPAYWGRRLESLLREEYTLRTNREIVACVEAIDPQRSYLASHLDGIVCGDTRGVYEAKTTGFHMRDDWGKPGTDDFPDRVKAQVEVYMHCARLNWADVVVLVGGQVFCIYHYEQDLQFRQILLDAIDVFWHDNVLANRPPEPKTSADCDFLFAKDDGSVFEADTELAAAVYEAQEIKDQIKGLAKRKEALELRMKQAFGPSQIMTGPDGAMLASWKTQQATRIDTKALRSAAPSIADTYSKTTEARVLRY